MDNDKADKLIFPERYIIIYFLFTTEFMRNLMIRAQAALEYLTTYGWAILIIAVVTVGLYSIGVLNPSTFASRAVPGSCIINRPYGVATIQLIQLQGLCNNEQPKLAPYFNGGSNVSIANSSLLSTNSVTVSLWVKFNPNSGYSYIIERGAIGNPGSFYIGNTSTKQIVFATYSNAGALTTTNFGATALNPNTWYYLTASYNPSTSTAATYINGVLSTTNSGASLGNSNPANTEIGSAINGGGFLNGYVSDVQIYNTSLSQNSIKLLYIGGIGSDPLQLPNLVGWWPLNGDTLDYSGNNNNANSNGIYFTESWNLGYNH